MWVGSGVSKNRTDFIFDSQTVQEKRYMTAGDFSVECLPLEDVGT
jgi:hypothetical protein